MLGVLFHSWGGWAKSVTFENNIFYADGAMRYDLGQAEGIVFRHNVFYGHHLGLAAGEKTISGRPEAGEAGRRS